MNTCKRVVGLIFVITLLGVTGAHGAVWYVTPTGMGLADGTSWENAGTLQATVSAAAAGDEVWVASGAYTAAESPVLLMKEGVAVYGGFSGAETAREQRDWRTAVATIDGGGERRCVAGANNAALDGFTITGGWDFDGGAGLYVSGGEMVVANCTFESNWAYQGGGGVYNDSGSMTITDCLFSGNDAFYGGGGLYNNAGASLVAENCMFLENAAERGGAIYNSLSTVSLSNCVISGNTVYFDGGGLYNDDSAVSLVNCTVTSNTASNQAGALYNSLTIPTLVNCILWNNSALEYPELDDDTGTYAVTYSCVAGGYPGDGNISADPSFVDLVGGDLRLQGESPCVDSATEAGAPDRDIRGIPRPQAGGWDMGAYETVAPVITLLGDNPAFVECGGGVYTDAGATAWDEEEGDLTAAVVVESDVIDTSSIGVYEIFYSVTNANGMAATEMVRTVNVVDTTGPVITLLGDAVVNVECHGVYTEPGYEANDACQGNLTPAVVVGGEYINTSVPGDYLVTYNVADAFLNEAEEVSRIVRVQSCSEEGEPEEFCPGNMIEDPLFESGDLELYWGALQGDPTMMLCSKLVCAAEQAYRGDYWVRFYNRLTDDVLSLGQEVWLPAGMTATLSYHYRGAAEATGRLEVYVAGVLVDAIDLPEMASEEYVERVVDLPAVVDEGLQLIEFVNPFLGGADIHLDGVCLQGEIPDEGEGEGEGEMPPMPVCGFVAIPLEGNAPLTVSFINQSENAESVRWHFGDDTESNEEHPVHVYEEPGTYEVELYAYCLAPMDCIVTCKQTIVVRPATEGEGEGEQPEGEGEQPEGEGEQPEGEGEQPEGEGEQPEGEGEQPEGELPEGEPSGNIDVPTGCDYNCDSGQCTPHKFEPRDIKRSLGDWLLIGISFMIMLSVSEIQRRR